MVGRWLVSFRKRGFGRLLRVAGLYLLVGCGFTGVAIAAQLKQVTIQAFNHYVTLTEDRMAGEIRDPGGFLWIDQLPPQQRQQILAQLRQGQVVTQKLETHENGKPIPIPEGMVHHWLATVFIPGVNLAQTLAQQKNYERSAQVYGPDIERCKVLKADGNDYLVYYRLHRKVLIESPTYNAEFDIRYFPIDATHEYSRSHSTRIAEIVNPGVPHESEKPIGEDLGYLWRLNTYSRYQVRDGGVYIQTEFLALSRSVPAIFAWLVNPYIKSIPQDYLVHLLGATRTDVMDTRADPARAGAAVNTKSY
jgi:hypothetical protein